MPKNINPIKLAKYKRARKQSKSIAQSLREAGAAESTATHLNNRNIGLVKIGEEQLAQELRHSDITPDLMIKHFTEDRSLALAKGDLSTATRVDELMSKSIAMLTDKSEVSQTLVIKADEKEELSRLRGKVLSNPLCTN
jgi:hypothetical protein